MIANIEQRIEEIKALMISKNKEYATNNNPFHNFEVAAGFHKNGTPKSALWGMVTKHLVSIKDYCEDTIELSKDQLDEKTKDIIIYCLLLNEMK